MTNLSWRKRKNLDFNQDFFWIRWEYGFWSGL